MSGYHGKFVWYELMTTDAKAAEAFYGSVVGWEARDSGMPGMAYMLLHAGEAMVAGLMAMPEEARQAGARPAWTGYVAVDDVDAEAERFKTEGGAVHHGPADIPGIGRFAVVGDPQGAVIALFKAADPEQAPPPVAPGTPGHVGWHELMAGDGASAFEFYARHFGWTKSRAMDMGDMGVYQLFARDGEDIGGMMTKPPQVPAPFWQYYFNVDSIEPAAQRVREGGGQILNGPMEVPGGQWIVQCMDPQGVMFSLVAPAG
ncbi:VOC family protein [Labrys wisconsinensis]|uniref:Enzyme related to lactoylglutathione lyase n=1 Tax=Labrys wisconsinensis TaxID=425677 RepID=A0ABU0J9R7_9HYPH|nr:VOC family protein [Labrys wisconsinensis]MDQ0471008.1 putative enzyme related to lactoylglutathione lyase [Labrys wisconsinensis]